MPWKYILLTLTLSIFGFAGVLTAGSLTPEQVQKLLADDGEMSDLFGVSVAIDGDTAVIGAHLHDAIDANSGSAYVFVRNGGVWTQQVELLPDDGEVGDLFGFWLSLDGNTAVIGAIGDDDSASNSGAAYVFVRSDGMWRQEAKLLADDGEMGDDFGYRASLDGDMVLVGARHDDDNGENSGSAYVFVRTEGTWAQQAKLLPDDGETDDQFGSSLNLNGDTAVIGSPMDDDNGENSGAAYVFIRSGESWIQQEKLLPDDGEANDQFSSSVTLDGDTAVIGASMDDDNGAGSGSAYVFFRSSGNWIQQAKLLPADGAAGDGFGFSASVDVDTVVIGALDDEDSGIASGSAYLFIRSSGIWMQEAKLLANDRARGDDFGARVSLDGNTVLISALLTDDNGRDSGSAYVFSLAEQNPEDLLDDLLNDLSELELPPGIEQGLNSKLDAALALLNDTVAGNDQAATNILVAFINQINAQRGKKVSEADADRLIAEAQEIIELLAGN